MLELPVKDTLRMIDDNEKIEVNKIYCGDCLDLIKKLDEESVDMVLTSPPYDSLRSYGNNDLMSFDQFIELANQLKRVMKQGASMVWIVSDQTTDGCESLTSFRQALYFKEIGLNVSDTMIWQKPTFTSIGNVSARYPQVFEYMFVIVKGKKPKTFNPIKDKHNVYSGEKIHGLRRINDGGFVKPRTSGMEIAEFGYRYNVWNVPPCVRGLDSVGHPAPFPLSLAEDHIRSWSNPGDLVLDPFIGSGTTAKACIALQRQYIGFEINRDYVEMAKRRIKSVQIKLF